MANGYCENCGREIWADPAREDFCEDCEKEMLLEDAFRVIENCAGFSDETSSAGEAWARVKKELEAQTQQAERAERALDRLAKLFETGADCPEICPLLYREKGCPVGCSNTIKAWALTQEVGKADERG